MMSDDFGPASLGNKPAGGGGGADAELQDFLMIEKQKAQVNAQVNTANSLGRFDYITSIGG